MLAQVAVPVEKGSWQELDAFVSASSQHHCNSSQDCAQDSVHEQVMTWTFTGGSGDMEDVVIMMSPLLRFSAPEPVTSIDHC